jgi:hypothetical protein
LQTSMRQRTTVPRYRSRCHVAAPVNVPIFEFKMQHTNALDDLAVDSTDNGASGWETL